MQTHHTNHQQTVSHTKHASIVAHPAAKLVRKHALPASDREMDEYASQLILSDAECLRTIKDQACCDRATD